MFDMHYDLLSVAYCAYLKNDYSFLEEWCSAYIKIMYVVLFVIYIL